MSIDIFFDFRENIDIKNLYLIFKSYIHEKDILLKAIYIIATNDIEYVQKKTTIFHNILFKKIEKMSFIDFQYGYETVLNNDGEYLQSFAYYGIRFVFYKESLYGKKKKIYPIYPGKEEFKKLYIKDSIDDKDKKFKKIQKELIITKIKLKRLGSLLMLKKIKKTQSNTRNTN